MATLDSTLSSSSRSPGGSGDSGSLAGSGGYEVYNGEIAELAPHEDIMKSLECPVCREIALAPIHTCENGHIICYTCRLRLRNCALCKVPFSDIRNYGLESIIAKSKFHCKYKEVGCTEVVLGETINDHVRSCKFRPLVKERKQLPQPVQRTRSRTLQVGQRNATSSTSTIGLDHPARLIIVEDVLSIEGENILYLRSTSPWNTSDDDGELNITVGWRSEANGRIPPNAVRGGYDDNGHETYVCRAYHGRTRLAGVICSASRHAYLNYFGRTKAKYYYDVLVAIPGTTRWVRGRRNAVPVNAVVGADQDGAETLYIGRTKLDDQWVSGYIKPSLGFCYVTNGTTCFGNNWFQYLVTVDV